MRYLLVMMLAPLVSAQELDKLSYFAGCWETQQGGTTIYEQWSKPGGGTLIGAGRTIKNGKTVFQEFLRVTAERGKLVYYAHVGTKDATPFPVKSLGADEVVFENPANDFPQRIIYRKTAGGLFARIEGTQKGKAAHEDFPYRRVACE